MASHADNFGVSFKFAHKSFDLHQGQQDHVVHLAVNKKDAKRALHHPSSLNSGNNTASQLMYNVSSSNKSGEQVASSTTHPVAAHQAAMNTLTKKELLKKSILMNNQKMAQSSCYSNLVVSSSYGK